MSLPFLPQPKPFRRLLDRIALNRAERSAWHNCKKLVDDRDKGKCRACHLKVIRTLDLHPRRAEHHHLVPRSITKQLVADRRNVLLVCLDCHLKLTRHELAIVGTAAQRFDLDGKSYLNADGELTFVST